MAPALAGARGFAAAAADGRRPCCAPALLQRSRCGTSWGSSSARNAALLRGARRRARSSTRRVPQAAPPVAAAVATLQRRTRLVDVIRSIPARTERYFRSPWRRAIYGAAPYPFRFLPTPSYQDAMAPLLHLCVAHNMLRHLHIVLLAHLPPIWAPGISLLGGFYVAQTISLSFGALGVNDVIAAAICVLFTEFVTKYVHSLPTSPTLGIALLNAFKLGFTYGLFIDAFKLAS
eukprot:SM000030S11441  [mRNA]  locus=s30:693090:694069:+ [translate_table: standard]